MKILAVNGSPSGKEGNTEQILQPFLKGASSAGADIEVVYLKDKKINYCLGCLTCWLKTPGVCVHKDDMPELLEQQKQADAIVFATSLYICTVSGLMKNFMDRSLPRLQPYIVKNGNHYCHPLRDGWKAHKVVLISSCGFPESQYFTGLTETFRLMSSLTPEDEFTGAILCTPPGKLTNPSLREHILWYLEACEAAGREVVEQGRISIETQAVLGQCLVEDPDSFMNKVNAKMASVLGNLQQ